MGLLATATKAAIPGNRVRQTWSIIRPTSAGATPSSAVVVGTTDTLRTSDTKARVIDCGTRRNSAGNISPKVFGEIDAGTYTVVMSNETGFFYYNTYPSAFELSGTGFWANPRECLLKHEVEQWDGSAWTHLPCSPWTGRITDIAYEDTPTAGATATIMASGFISDVVKKTWDNTAHTAITTVLDPYSPSGILLSTMTRGWDLISTHYHVWLQVTTGAACTGLMTFTRSFTETSFTSTTSSGTLHQFSVDIGTILYGGFFSLQFTRTSDSHVFTYATPVIPQLLSSEPESARPF